MGTKRPLKPELAPALADIRGEVRFEALLRDLTSIRIGGPAEVLVVPEDLEDLCRLITQTRAAQLPVFVLGGTNVVVRDGGLRGVVVSLAKLTSIRDEGSGIVYAEAGVRMPTLLRHAISQSFSGLEWAAGIPGTVGGGVVMNAGTRLGEMKDALHAVHFLQPDGHLSILPRASIPFSYRHAALPEGVVAGAWFQLTPGSRQKIETATKTYLRYRKSTQPLTQPNAGSVFKNPPQGKAGELIEGAGLKGLRIGDVQVSQKHANFIINAGQARASDVLLLIKNIQQTVFQQTGVALELELKIVGDP